MLNPNESDFTVEAQADQCVVTFTPTQSRYRVAVTKGKFGIVGVKHDGATADTGDYDPNKVETSQSRSLELRASVADMI